VYERLSCRRLTIDEQQLVEDPAIVLWCVIRNSHGHVLGLLLLGMRDDLDPYRQEDQVILQRLIAAASLAFTNSAAYVDQQQAEVLIRQLYRQLQTAQDAAAIALTRELHDEIINVNIRLNIEALKKTLHHIADPQLYEELKLILETEQSVATALRMICERLYPTGLDDPLGLPAVLRLQVQQIAAGWAGDCRLVVTGTPQPLSAQVQREVLRIARESLTNAIKHADATMILVELGYPAESQTHAQLIVRDNGQQDQGVCIRPGHWGVRFMQESARTIEAHLCFDHTPDGGTIVTLVFPLNARTIREYGEEQTDGP
jgi:signal transduction histidine kinase